MSEPYRRLQREIEELDDARRPFLATRALERALRVLPPGPEAHQIRRHLRQRKRTLEPHPGRAWFPITSGPARYQGGLLRVEIREGEPSREPGAFSDAKETIEITKRLLSRDEIDLYATIHPAEGLEGLEGQSFQLAVALATWSALNGQPIPHGVAATGMLEPNGEITTPDGLHIKIEVIREAWGHQARLLTGRGDPHENLEHRDTLRDAVLGGLGYPFTDGLTHQKWRDKIDRHIKAHQWDRVAGAVTRALQAGEGEIGADELYRLAKDQARALSHRGRSEEVLKSHTAAEIWASDADPNDLLVFSAIYGNALIDLNRHQEAVEHLQAQLDAFPQVGLNGIRGDFCRTQLLGTCARAYSALDRHEEAIEAAREALSLTRPEERARNRHDLAFWLLRAGQLDAAQVTLEEAKSALELTRRYSPYSADYTQRFIDLTQARIYAQRGDLPRAEALTKAIQHGGDPVLYSGVLEIHLQARQDVEFIEPHIGESLALARLRARVELHRPNPDLERVKGWLKISEIPDPSATLKTLKRQLPY